MRTFLAAKGVDFMADQQDKYITILKLAEGSLDEEQLAAWVRKCIA